MFFRNLHLEQGASFLNEDEFKSPAVDFSAAITSPFAPHPANTSSYPNQIPGMEIAPHPGPYHPPSEESIAALSAAFTGATESPLPGMELAPHPGPYHPPSEESNAALSKTYPNLLFGNIQSFSRFNQGVAASSYAAFSANSSDANTPVNSTTFFPSYTASSSSSSSSASSAKKKEEKELPKSSSLSPSSISSSGDGSSSGRYAGFYLYQNIEIARIQFEYPKSNPINRSRGNSYNLLGFCTAPKGVGIGFSRVPNFLPIKINWDSKLKEVISFEFSLFSEGSQLLRNSFAKKNVVINDSKDFINKLISLIAIEKAEMDKKKRTQIRNLNKLLLYSFFFHFHKHHLSWLSYRGGNKPHDNYQSLLWRDFENLNNARKYFTQAERLILHDRWFKSGIKTFPFSAAMDDADLSSQLVSQIPVAANSSSSSFSSRLPNTMDAKNQEEEDLYASEEEELEIPSDDEEDEISISKRATESISMLFKTKSQTSQSSSSTDVMQMNDKEEKINIKPEPQELTLTLLSTQQMHTQLMSVIQQWHDKKREEDVWAENCHYLTAGLLEAITLLLENKKVMAERMETKRVSYAEAPHQIEYAGPHHEPKVKREIVDVESGSSSVAAAPPLKKNKQEKSIKLFTKKIIFSSAIRTQSGLYSALPQNKFVQLVEMNGGLVKREVQSIEDQTYTKPRVNFRNIEEYLKIIAENPVHGGCVYGMIELGRGIKLKDGTQKDEVVHVVTFYATRDEVIFIDPQMMDKKVYRDNPAPITNKLSDIIGFISERKKGRMTFCDQVLPIIMGTFHSRFRLPEVPIAVITSTEEWAKEPAQKKRKTDKGAVEVQELVATTSSSNSSQSSSSSFMGHSMFNPFTQVSSQALLQPPQQSQKRKSAHR